MSFDMERPAPVEDAGHSQAAKRESAETHSIPASNGQASKGAGLDLFAELQDFFYKSANRPSHEYSLAATVGFLAGVTGRAYNTWTRTGLNQYVLALGATGSNKEAISSGTSKLFSRISESCPAVMDFRGPGELVSSAGLLRWLDKKPCSYSIVGEIGKMMKMMAAHNAPPHLKSVNRILLQLTGKSGHGERFDAAAYADADKNIGSIESPAFTMLGESVPEVLYEALDEGMVTDGLLSRLLIFEHTGPRLYRNKLADTFEPDTALIAALSDLAANCLGLMHRRQVQHVACTAEAEAKFDELDEYTTDEINGASGQSHKELLNRVQLKAIRLACLKAIGRNYLHPVVTLEDTLWAGELVLAQTNNLIGKFSNGQIGEQAGSQTEQQRLVLWAMSDFLQNYEKLTKFFPHNRSYEYASQGVVPYAHISQRIAGYKAFKSDRFALKNAIKELLEMDFIREMPPTQMGAKFGGKGRGFVMADVHAVHQIVSRH